MEMDNAYWHFDWDYKGAEKSIAVYSPYTQSDWNQTLITRINQVSANIYQASLAGGANAIILNSEMLQIVSDLAYYDGALGVISGKYKVIIDDSITSDVIFVLNKKQYDKDFEVTGKPTIKMGLLGTNMVEVEPHLADILKGVFTFESQNEIEEYKNRLVGCITILNFPYNPNWRK
jgi:hypothetical protein